MVLLLLLDLSRSRPQRLMGLPVHLLLLVMLAKTLLLLLMMLLWLLIILLLLLIMLLIVLLLVVLLLLQRLHLQVPIERHILVVIAPGTKLTLWLGLSCTHQKG